MISIFDLRLELNDKSFAAYVLEDTKINSKNDMVNVRCPELMPDINKSTPTEAATVIHKKTILKNSKKCTPVDHGDKLTVVNYLVGRVMGFEDEVVDIESLYTSLDRSLTMSKAKVKKEVTLKAGDKVSLYFENGKFSKPRLLI